MSVPSLACFLAIESDSRHQIPETISCPTPWFVALDEPTEPSQPLQREIGIEAVLPGIGAIDHCRRRWSIQNSIFVAQRELNLGAQTSFSPHAGGSQPRRFWAISPGSTGPDLTASKSDCPAPVTPNWDFEPIDLHADRGGVRRSIIARLQQGHR
jgi:hypothetical protein